MNQAASEYIAALQAIGPVKWAESEHGWIGEDGQPIKLAPWQRAALNAWWKHRKDTSTFAISNTKKTGKTFCNAILTCYRWLALPGQHFTAGNDLDQAQARQFSMIAEMVQRNSFLGENIKAGKSELVFTLTGSKLTALAADATGNAGANFLTASHTEVWGVLFENSIRSFEELSPVPGKFYGLPCLRIADSYAGFLGESKTWHKLIDRGIAGKRLPGEWPIFQAGGLLLFHFEGTEAQERCFRGSEAERIDYYAEQAESLRPNAFTRMHLNQRTSGESQFVTPEQWDACYSPDLHPLIAGERVKLSIGIDASQKHDYSALIGMDGGDLRLVKVWKPKRGLFGKNDPIDLEASIGQAVLELHKAGNIQCVVYDPWQMAAIARSFEKAGIRCQEMPQTNQRIESDTALYNAIISGRIRHFKNQELDEAIRNAIIVETPRGLRIKKEAASRKIDALVAMSMAYSAALSGKYQGTVTYITNPFDFEPAPDGPEMAYHHYFGWVPDGSINFKPHPEGVTYLNCKKRNKGCAACVAEIEAAGINDIEREKIKSGFYTANAQALEQMGRSINYLQGDNKNERILSKFWKGVSNRLAKHD